MDRMIFVNLPVRDMARSQAFFRQLGFDFDARFTNEQCASLVIREDAIYAMLLLEPFFQTFTGKQVADARQTAQVLICLSCSSREEVDALMAKALAAGATEPGAPKDNGFMYYRTFDDLDGHGWELMWMDRDAAPPQF